MEIFIKRTKTECRADSFHFETHMIASPGNGYGGRGTAVIKGENMMNGHSMTIEDTEQIYIDMEGSKKW